MRYSKSFLRKSTSSFDLQFSFVKGQLGALKEIEDEDLTLPFEPKDHSLSEESQELSVKEDKKTQDGGKNMCGKILTFRIVGKHR